MWLRKIKFKLKWDKDRYIPAITNFILDYASEKNLVILKIRIRTHFNDFRSVVWIWCTYSQKMKFAKALFEYANGFIEDTVL